MIIVIITLEKLNYYFTASNKNVKVILTNKGIVFA